MTYPATKFTDVDITGALAVTGNLTGTGDITRTGNLALTGNLTGTGNITRTGNIALTGNLTGTGDITRTGNEALTGNLTGTGNITRTGNANISGAIYGGGVQQLITIPLGAVSATTSVICAIADFAGTITSVKLATKDAVTANDTDYWTFALTNKGQAGAGTTVVATRHTKATGGLGMAAYTHYDVTVSGTPADVAVVADDVLLFTATKSASATALAEAVLVIKYVPTAV